MEKIMYAGITATETANEYCLTESHEAEFGREWGGDIKAYLRNAAEDEDAVLEAMGREYIGAIHSLPAEAIVLTAEDGVPYECYWVVA